MIGKDSGINTSRALGDFDFPLPQTDDAAAFISSQPYLLIKRKTRFVLND